MVQARFEHPCDRPKISILRILYIFLVYLMPSIEANRKAWNNMVNWHSFGEDWSGPWGGSDLQWWGTIFPRIHLFVPTDTILEIAPGFGRWTNFLRRLCKQLIVVDVAKLSIDTCIKRFSDSSNISYYVNDGKSLSMIQNDSIDFAFTYDSLPHADEDAIEGYVNELSRKLKKNGVAFIHHSNMGKYIHSPMKIIWDRHQKIPGFIKFFRLANPFLRPAFAWRGKTMTAEKFEEFSKKAGLCCISQECINWAGWDKLIDCFSIITPNGSIWERPNKVLQNYKFSQESVKMKRIAELYGDKSFQFVRNRTKQ